MRFKPQFKKRWKGFLKRSPEYKLSCLYGIVGLFFFCFTFYCLVTIASTYKHVENSFMIETPEQFRLIGFSSMLVLFCGSMFCLAILFFIGMLIFVQIDHNARLKKIEDYLEENSVFDFSKDEG